MSVSSITERDYKDMYVCGKHAAEMAEIRQSLAVQTVKLLGLERMAQVSSLMETQSVCV
jgi:hypothetical protein